MKLFNLVSSRKSAKASMSFEERILQDVNDAATSWNAKMHDPNEKQRLIQDIHELKARAYENAKEITSPGYVDPHRKYIG